MEKTEINQRISAISQRFHQYSSWEDRYKEIIKIGRNLSGLHDIYKSEKFRIKGCQSQVWLHANLVDGKVILSADSDAILVKGIIGLLVEVYSDATPDAILETPPRFLQEIGITEHLSMNRSNGLANMVKQIQMYATAFAALIKKGVHNANL